MAAIIRELQLALSENYISGSSVRVVIDVFSAMAAYFVQTCCAFVWYNVQNLH
jgi:hypothetical protein